MIAITSMAKSTILIVDDEDQFRESLSEALEEEFHVLAASNVRKGLSIIDENTLSLILLDLRMPGLTGVDLLERLSSRNNNTPVFILTGNSCQDWAEKCADFNVQGYIRKPVNVVSLICRIKKVLGIEDFEVLRELWGCDYEAKKALISPNIVRALGYIRQNYHNGIDRGDIAAFLEISPDYLSRQFHKECGLSLHDYINRFRMLKSKELLHDSRRKIKEIAAAVGIRDVSYFCSMFKEYTGMTPKEYQNKRYPDTRSIQSSVQPRLTINKHASVAERSV